MQNNGIGREAGLSPEELEAHSRAGLLPDRIEMRRKKKVRRGGGGCRAENVAGGNNTSTNNFNCQKIR